MRSWLNLIIISLSSLLGCFHALGATIQSTAGGGNWNVPASWVGGVVPVAADDVVIVSGSTINVTTSPSCNHLRIEGILANTTDNTTLSVGGNLTLAGTGSMTGNNDTRNINVNGNLISESGADGVIAGMNVLINGTTNLQGRILFDNATGSKIFIGNVSINEGGVIDFDASVTLVFTGSMDMNGNSAIGTTTSISGSLVGVNSFIVNTGANATIGRVNLIVVGLSQFNGTTVFNNNFGTKSFIGGGTINTNASIDFTSGATISFNNTLTMNGTSSIGTASSSTGTINVNSSFVVSAAASATLGRANLLVTGTSSIQGAFIQSVNSGTKTLTGNVTVGAVGSITFSAPVPLNLSNDLITTPGAIIGNSGITGTIRIAGNFVPATGGVSSIQGITLFRVAGDFNVTNSAIVNTSNNNTITVLGNWNITNSGAVNLGAGTNSLSVTGNWNIQDNAAVDAGSGTTTITLQGNWNVTSAIANPFMEGTSTVTLNNSSALQTITSTESAGETFYRVVFNNTSGLNPGISTTVNINAQNIAMTTGNLDMAGRDMIITGNSTTTTDNFTAGTLFSSASGSDLVITDPSKNKTIRFTGTTIGTAARPFGIAVTAGSIYFDGADFFATGTGTFTRTGAGDNDCNGGTIFTGNYTLTQAAGAGRWIMGTGGPDVFVNNVSLVNNSSQLWILARASSGNEYRGTTVITNTSAGGYSFGRASGGGSIRSILFAGAVTINQTGSGSIDFAVSNATIATTVTFQGDIMMTSTAGSNGGISMGDSGNGSIVLTSASRFNIAAGSVLGSNTIALRRLTQNGTTLAQNIVLSGTATLDVGVVAADGATFNAPVTFSAPALQLRYAVFNGSSNTFTQTGTGGVNSNNGGNVFSNQASFVNQGTKIWRLGATDSDDFNSNVSFVRSTGTSGLLDPAYSNNSTFAANFSTTGSAAVITASAAAGGRVTFDGPAAKSINGDVGFPPVFTYLTLDGGSLTLNVPASIASDLNFTSGIITTTSVNLLTFNAGSAISGTPSNTSHVDGPVRKVGNSAFTFPTGDAGIYRAIGIGAPSAAAHHFTAEFFKTAHPYLDAVASPLISISRCEYWNLAQSAPGSNVTVTLNWNTPDCTPPSPYITTPSGLAVARWNGSTQWVNEGNGGTSGNATTGSVISASAAGGYGAFVLGSTTLSNPLPIELIRFSAEPGEGVVDLFWSTASERNNDYFTVQRSKDGNEFESIADLPGAPNGQSYEQLDYQYRDSEPLKDVSYYRLRQTDFDNKTSFSNVVKVNLNQIEKLKIYPNPVSFNNSVKTNVTSAFMIFDAVGKLKMKTEKTNHIEVTGFAPGVYLLRSETGLFTKLVVE